MQLKTLTIPHYNKIRKLKTFGTRNVLLNSPGIRLNLGNGEEHHQQGRRDHLCVKRESGYEISCA